MKFSVEVNLYRVYVAHAEGSDQVRVRSYAVMAESKQAAEARMLRQETAGGRAPPLLVLASHAIDNGISNAVSTEVKPAAYVDSMLRWYRPMPSKAAA